jgi:hypothetical protein
MAPKIESASIEILNPKLNSLLQPTAADRKWMGEIVTTVDNSWNDKDPTRPADMHFIGSEDFLRAKFEVCPFPSCMQPGSRRLMRKGAG